MTTTGPIGGTGPRNLPPINTAAIRDRLRALDARTKYLEKNRIPTPIPMGGVANASRMQVAQLGHAPVYSEAQGGFVPSPVLATLLFHLPGGLIVATSDPLHARYSCDIIGISADLGTFSSDCTFVVYVNGSPVYTVGMTSVSTGLIIVSPTPLAPYTDLVTVACTDAGTGNSGLVVNVELGVVTGSTAGP